MLKNYANMQLSTVGKKTKIKSPVLLWDPIGLENLSWNLLIIDESNKNVTFTLPVYLIQKYRGYAAEKHISSISAGVREALVKYSYKIEEEILIRR